MTLCATCKHFQNDCDIIIKIQEIADTYNLELNVKIQKCAAYANKDATL